MFTANWKKNLQLFDNQNDQQRDIQKKKAFEDFKKMKTSGLSSKSNNNKQKDQNKQKSKQRQRFPNRKQQIQKLEPQLMIQLARQKIIKKSKEKQKSVLDKSNSSNIGQKSKNIMNNKSIYKSKEGIKQKQYEKQQKNSSSILNYQKDSSKIIIQNNPLSRSYTRKIIRKNSSGKMNVSILNEDQNNNYSYILDEIRQKQSQINKKKKLSEYNHPSLYKIVRQLKIVNNELKSIVKGYSVMFQAFLASFQKDLISLSETAKGNSHNLDINYIGNGSNSPTFMYLPNKIVTRVVKQKRKRKLSFANKVINQFITKKEYHPLYKNSNFIVQSQNQLKQQQNFNLSQIEQKLFQNNFKNHMENDQVEFQSPIYSQEIFLKNGFGNNFISQSNENGIGFSSLFAQRSEMISNQIANQIQRKQKVQNIIPSKQILNVVNSVNSLNSQKAKQIIKVQKKVTNNSQQKFENKQKRDSKSKSKETSIQRAPGKILNIKNLKKNETFSFQKLDQLDLQFEKISSLINKIDEIVS